MQFVAHTLKIYISIWTHKRIWNVRINSTPDHSWLKSFWIGVFALRPQVGVPSLTQPHNYIISLSSALSQSSQLPSLFVCCCCFCCFIMWFFFCCSFVLFALFRYTHSFIYVGLVFISRSCVSVYGLTTTTTTWTNSSNNLHCHRRAMMIVVTRIRMYANMCS